MVLLKRLKAKECGEIFTRCVCLSPLSGFGMTSLCQPTSCNPLFYQRVSDLILEELITEQYSVAQVHQPIIPPLTFEEANALRYVSGYVCNKLRKKIMKSKLPSKGDLLLCLVELCDEDDDVSSSADWTRAIDRGGLCHVSENTYLVFNQLELLVQKFFNDTSVQDVTSDLRMKVKDCALTDEEISFYWCMLTVNVDNEIGAELLSMIIDLYITIRGFSFSKSFMERYRQQSKKSTQKSKALRKNLLSKSN